MTGRRSGWTASLGLTLTLVGASPARPAELPPEELLRLSDRTRGGGWGGLSWRIHVESSERGQSREVVIRATGENWLAEFVSPPKVKNQKLLVRGRHMWFVQPGLSKPVPLSPRQRLIGEAAIGDILDTRYAEDYAGTLAGEETVSGETAHVLDLTAKHKNVTYDRIRYWVSTTRRVGLKAEFYTISGKLMKTATFEYGNRVAFEGRQVPMISRMDIVDAVKHGSRTVLVYSEIVIGEVPAATFDLSQITR